MQKLESTAQPTGFTLKLFRAPLYLYHLKLGFLLGERFIRLKHWGRKSGALRETVLEVIDQNFDQKKAARKVYVASGFGEQSQWFKNIAATDSVFITLNNIEHAAIAKILPIAEATDVLLRYAAAHPKSIKSVAKLSGYDIDGSIEDIIEFSHVIKVVEFTLE